MTFSGECPAFVTPKPPNSVEQSTECTAFPTVQEYEMINFENRKIVVWEHFIITLLDDAACHSTEKLAVNLCIQWTSR